MDRTITALWKPPIILVTALALTITAGCIDNFNIRVSGYVRNMADSSAVPGAFLLRGGSSTTTDSNGFYEFGGYSPEHDEAVEMLLIVTDVDGENNGIFVSRDTLVILDGTQHLQDIELHINLYVEMVGDGPGISPATCGGV
jgi:hypothetical protein